MSIFLAETDNQVEVKAFQFTSFASLHSSIVGGGVANFSLTLIITSGMGSSTKDKTIWFSFGVLAHYTANVFSAEIADECLQTKSTDNLQ